MEILKYSSQLIKTKTKTKKNEEKCRLSYPRIILKYRKLPLKLDMQDILGERTLFPSIIVRETQFSISFEKSFQKQFLNIFDCVNFCFLVKRNSRIDIVDSKKSNARLGNVTRRGISLMKKIEGKKKGKMKIKRKDVLFKMLRLCQEKTIFFFSIQIVRNLRLTVCFNQERVMRDRKW